MGFDSLKRDHLLSRLVLGTAQFGMPYGVANRTGQPEYPEVLSIVRTAVEGGVHFFDTAAAYGTSEEVLGRALVELGAAERVVVVTKVRPLSAAELADSTAARRAIQQSLETSRQRLRLDCLPIVLFHREADARYHRVLEEFQAKGWLRRFGVSCDNFPGAAGRLVNAGQISALQVPANVLDRRHQRSGIFQEAAARDAAIFTRSVFLQGLLVMPEEDIPEALREVIPARRELSSIARKAGMDLPELALRYMLGQEGVTGVLTGVETAAQLRENLSIFGRGPLPGGILDAIERTTIDIPEMIITPRLWPTDGTLAGKPRRQ